MLAEEYDADLWKTNAKGELPLHDAVRSGRKGCNFQNKLKIIGLIKLLI